MAQISAGRGCRVAALNFALQNTSLFQDEADFFFYVMNLRFGDSTVAKENSVGSWPKLDAIEAAGEIGYGGIGPVEGQRGGIGGVERRPG